MKYQRYAAYKDSGVEWLGDVPEHWFVNSINYILNAIGDVDHYMPQSVENGIPYVMTGDLKELVSSINFKDCKQVSHEDYIKLSQKIKSSKGDLIVARYATIGTASYVDIDADFLVSYSCVTIKPNLSKAFGLYLFYYFKSNAFLQGIQNQINTNTQGNVGISDLKKVTIALPTLAEQSKIIEFLDKEVSKIDTLTEKQRRLIELLKEKRQAVISHAVTKGLNRNAPMKNSGVEWLGEVPEHWRVCAIKHQLSSLDFKRIPLSAEERGSRSGEFRYYGASGVIDYIDDYIFDESTVLVGEDGANLVNRNTPLAFSAHGKYWVNNHAHILKSDDGLADYWAETIEHIDINPLVSGSAQPKLTAENLNNLKIAFPPSVEERIEIDNFISEIKSKFDFLMSKAKQQIELLQERRTALISAAVTGKIDVRQWESADTGIKTHEF